MKSAGKALAAAIGATMLGVAMLLGVASCNSNGCNDNRSSIPLAGFYSSTDGKAIALDKVNIGGVGAPNDSLLLSAGKSATQVFLPFRHTATTTAFFIEYKYIGLDSPEMTDYIEFGYQTIPYFASEECGAMYRYRITSVDYTRHLIDSVAVIPADSMIVNVERQYLKIFFRTSDGGGESL